MQTERKKITLDPSRRLTLFASLCVSALLGVLLGAVCCCSVDSQLLDMLGSAEENLFSIRRSGDLAKIVFNSLAGTGFYLLITFALGFSAISQPFEMLVPFFRGLGCGVILTQIYGDSFSKLSALKAAAVLPGIFISLVVIILASREALFLSVKLFKVCFQDRLFDGLLQRIKLYSVRFLAFLAAASAASAIDCILAMLLLGKL